MQSIGVKIRKWRESRHITREELANTAGLTEGFLIALEEENLLPSLGPLHKISRALGVRLGTFMDDQPCCDPIITRQSDHQNDLAVRLARAAAEGHGYTALAKGKADRNMEPFFLDLAEGSCEEVSSHQGEEFIYALKGSIRIRYGNNYHTLHAGDSMYYNSLLPHSACSENGPAQALVVIYFPE